MTPSAQLSVGNDLVDLNRREPVLHQRFIERVFSQSEMAAVECSMANLWLHWAAKEAAYKMIKRLEPETVFSPVKFVFDSSLKTLTYNDNVYSCLCEIKPNYVHVVCASQPELLKSSALHLWINDIGDQDPSEAVRNLAVERLAALLNISNKQLSVSPPARGMLPHIFLAGSKMEHLLSFSHHGRFVACCCYLMN